MENTRLLCIFILICHVEALSRQTDNDRFDEMFFTSKVIAGAKAKKKKKTI